MNLKTLKKIMHIQIRLKIISLIILENLFLEVKFIEEEKDYAIGNFQKDVFLSSKGLLSNCNINLIIILNIAGTLLTY